MYTVVDDRRVIVIGSGPAGATAALTLLRRGIPVTMLESGQTLPRGLLIRAMGHTVYRRWPTWQTDDHAIDAGTSKALWFRDLVPGGLSNHWVGTVPRFAPEDFNEGERLHERYRWPITYSDLQPYYEEVERLLVVSGDTSDAPQLPAGHVAYRRHLPHDWHHVAACAEGFGHGLVPAPMALGSSWMFSRSAAPFNSYTRIVRRLHHFPEFRLLLGAHALRIEWNGERKLAHSVVYLDRRTSSERSVAGAAIVVAAGALASTKLLLDSACADFPSGLGDNNGILGRYLHDHAHDWYPIELDRPLSRLSHPIYLTRAPYEGADPLRATQSTFGGSSESKLDKVLALLPSRTQRFGVNTFGSLVPLETNRVWLDPTAKDDFGLPRLNLDFCFDDDVPRTLMAARERVLAILDAAGLHATTAGEPPVLTPGRSVHYGGTVRMHSSPQYGMLDAWNRMHAVANVVVADASSFTTGVEKNPTPTVMALAARAADRLAADLKEGGISAPVHSHRSSGWNSGVSAQQI